jgi:hypothetical protein
MISTEKSFTVFDPKLFEHPSVQTVTIRPLTHDVSDGFMIERIYTGVVIIEVIVSVTNPRISFNSNNQIVNESLVEIRSELASRLTSRCQENNDTVDAKIDEWYSRWNAPYLLDGVYYASPYGFGPTRIPDNDLPKFRHFHSTIGSIKSNLETQINLSAFEFNPSRRLDPSYKKVTSKIQYKVFQTKVPLKIPDLTPIDEDTEDDWGDYDDYYG